MAQGIHKVELDYIGAKSCPIILLIRPRMDFEAINLWEKSKRSYSHQQYLAKNPEGYCGLKGTGVSCPIGGGVQVPAH